MHEEDYNLSAAILVDESATSPEVSYEVCTLLFSHMHATAPRHWCSIALAHTHSWTMEGIQSVKIIQLYCIVLNNTVERSISSYGFNTPRPINALLFDSL